MFSFHRIGGSDHAALVEALSRSLAIIEFDLTGHVLTANENFCKALGYALTEIKGKHHSLFVEPAYAASRDYAAFWEKLGRGEHDAGEYKRVAKGGRDIWIQATYNPVRTSKGVPYKVVKVAANITEEKLRNAEFAAKISAISRVQAVIEFTPSGNVITANDNFLTTLGYGLPEIQGKHHSMFVDPTYAQSADYRDFWATLNRGEFVAAEFMRIGRGGKEVYIQASYNPVFDLNGNVAKIVKFATDVTDRVRAVKDVSAGLSQLASNNLEHRIETAFAPSFEKLRTDYNGSLDILQSTMQTISINTEAMQSGAIEIATASDELSRRTEQQAANLEETSAALEGITGTVKKSAEGAAHARQVVSVANEDAKRCSVVVRQAVDAMDLIAKSAQQISQIIGVIDEIAFQTNLLALNAGVEAARAGEAGRGFAVVASEVRALAQRSAEAAKEIKTLISTSGSEVATGVKLVAETGVSLDRIMAQVNDINGIIVEIANGAKEQATGLVEINTAIAQMDQATQQNAAMSEESTAASHSLRDKSEELGALVREFRIGQAGSNPVRGGAQRPAAGTRAPVRPRGPAQPRLIANGGAAATDNGWEEF